METYIGLIFATLMPALFSGIIFVLDKHTKLKNIKPIIKEIIIGIVFGGLAVLGTEFGVKTDTGAVINTRDGAVLTASFFFGWKAGIIAGIIGGVERWLCVYWGGGAFTRIACTVSTIFAGFFGAFIRKIMLKDRKPNWAIASVMAFVMETIHMTMVFLTNFSTPEQAIQVVELCTPLMLSLNSVSVLLSSLVLTWLNKEKLFVKYELPKIQGRLRVLLLGTVAAAFVLSSTFIYFFQHQVAKNQVELDLTQATEDIVNDVDSRVSDSMFEELRDFLIVNEDEIMEGNEFDVEGDYEEFYYIDTRKYGNGSYYPNYGFITNSSDRESIYVDIRHHDVFKQFNNFLDDNSITFDYLAIGYSALDENKIMKYFACSGRYGYLIVGLSEEMYSSKISALIYNLAENRRIGSTGFVAITNRNGIIYSAPDWFINSHEVEDEEYGGTICKYDSSVEKESLVHTNLLNKDGVETEYYATMVEVEGFHVYAFISTEEALEVQNITVYMNTFLEIIIFAFIFIQIFIVIRNIVTDKLDKVNDSLKIITSGNLNEVVDVNDTKEFKELSDDINQTVGTLKNYIEEAEKRNEKEMELAKNIQKSALPVVSPKIQEKKFIDIFASMNAAKEVGGDFYDFYLTDENTLNILIADVSGKGIPAAMFMMKGKAILKGLTEKGLPLEEVFTEGNRELCESNDAGMFITAWQAQINLQTGNVKFVNAGHNPPLIKGESGKYEYLKARAGFVLAGMDGFKYKVQEFNLADHDQLFLYTDGVTEATNINKELLGEDRLLSVLNEKNYDSSKDICERVLKEVFDFTGEAPQFDDVTMLSFMFKSRPLIRELEKCETSIPDILEYTEFVENALNDINASMKDIMKINIALDEILSNIINHGYNGKGGYIKVRLHQSDDLSSIAISFIDKGIPYNPITEKEPDTTLALEDRKVGGLGIYMVKKSMDDMKYKYTDGKNVLTITKKLF